MGDQEDIMLTFRQKIQLNNNEHKFFRQEVDSWRDEMENRRDEPTTLEDICLIESSEDEECSDQEDELIKKVNMFLEKGEWARAISMSTLAISKKPTPRFYTNRALAYLKRCNLAEAEKDCTEAINLNPQYTKAYIRRALARKLLGKCKESCEDMEVILKLDPDNEIVAIEYEAMLDYHQKNLRSIESSDVDQEKQEMAMKLKQLGNDLVNKSQYKKALEKFTSAIKLNPKEPTFYANRAICRMKLKDFVTAEKDCSEALELDGEYAKVYLRRARVRKCLGKLYDSRQDFYSAFELTQDEKVLEELEQVERSVRLMETQRDKSEESGNRDNVYSILEKDNSGQPKLVRLDGIVKSGSSQIQDSKDANIAKNTTKGGRQPQKFAENNVTNDGTLFKKTEETSKHARRSTDRSSSQKENTKISIPESKSDATPTFSSKYDITEVFPLNRDDPSVKFSGPFIRVGIKEGNFAVPEKLLEVPDDLMKI